MDTGGGALPAAHRRKRPLERGKYEQLNRVMDKMYKRSYWEDPAYAWRLRHFGLDLARDAAYENLFERAAREHAAWLAARQQHTPAAGAAAAAAAADPVLPSCTT